MGEKKWFKCNWGKKKREIRKHRLEQHSVLYQPPNEKKWNDAARRVLWKVVDGRFSG